LIRTLVCVSLFCCASAVFFQLSFVCRAFAFCHTHVAHPTRIHSG
jgi:hypothetical protein